MLGVGGSPNSSVTLVVELSGATLACSKLRRNLCGELLSDTILDEGGSVSKWASQALVGYNQSCTKLNFYAHVHTQSQRLWMEMLIHWNFISVCVSCTHLTTLILLKSMPRAKAMFSMSLPTLKNSSKLTDTLREICTTGGV